MYFFIPPYTLILKCLKKARIQSFLKPVSAYFKKIIKLVISVFTLGLLFSFSTLWYFSSDLPDYKILAGWSYGRSGTWRPEWQTGHADIGYDPAGFGAFRRWD